ncbi:BatD family protein, partial [Flavobacterium sp.]|uniref:BatD family protein n=1 Tax=Flavobacterium sp. TaxID=239 RepID=UPI0037538C18
MKFKLYIYFFLIPSSLFAQKVTTSIDTTRNKIGAEFKLTIKASISNKDKVIFPKDKNFGALEVIESYKIDTIKSNDSYELIKKYGLTQFDSGRYTIPKIPILINGKSIFSDSINIEVSNVKVDTLKQKMFDIKTIEKVKIETNYWVYIIPIIILLALLLLVFWLFKKYKNRPKKELEIVYKTPIEKATSLLQSLEKKELWQNGEVKEYYSQLTDIVRTYIEEEIQIPAMESTTSELIFSLKKVASQKKMKLNSETLKNLEKVLKQADLVKFAKVKPLDFEIEEDKKRITNAVVKIHDAVPQIVEETDELQIWNEEQKQKSIAKKYLERKVRRIKAAILIGLIV